MIRWLLRRSCHVEESHCRQEQGPVLVQRTWVCLGGQMRVITPPATHIYLWRKRVQRNERPTKEQRLKAAPKKTVLRPARSQALPVWKKFLAKVLVRQTRESWKNVQLAKMSQWRTNRRSQRKRKRKLKMLRVLKIRSQLQNSWNTGNGWDRTWRECVYWWSWFASGRRWSHLWSVFCQLYYALQVCVIDTAHIVCGRVYIMLHHPSVSPMYRPLLQCVAGLLMWACWAGDINNIT